MFELASHLSSLVGTSNVVLSTPHRYNAIRMRRIATTFGLDHVIGTPLPWDELEPDKCRLCGGPRGAPSSLPYPPLASGVSTSSEFPFFMSDPRSLQERPCSPITTRSGSTPISSVTTSTAWCGITGLTAPPVHVVAATGNVVRYRPAGSRGPVVRPF